VVRSPPLISERPLPLPDGSPTVAIMED
jgi:hypothetical protein